jgi:hypothetical protein
MDLSLRLPQMLDMNDGGKSIIHKCAQIKSSAILKKVVNHYKKEYMEHHKS